MPFPAENSPDPDGEFPLATPEYLFYLLFQIDRQRDMAFEPLLQKHGLALHGWRTLSIIRRLDGCTMKTLAVYSTIDRTTLTRVVDQLVEEGLVARTTPPSDRRKVSLTLTDAGEAMHAKAVAELIAFNRAILKPLSPARQREVTRAMQTILRAVVTDDALAEGLLTYGRPGDRSGRF